MNDRIKVDIFVEVVDNEINIRTENDENDTVIFLHLSVLEARELAAALLKGAMKIELGETYDAAYDKDIG